MISSKRLRSATNSRLAIAVRSALTPESIVHHIVSYLIIAAVLIVAGVLAHGLAGLTWPWIVALGVAAFFLASAGLIHSKSAKVGDPAEWGGVATEPRQSSHLEALEHERQGYVTRFSARDDRLTHHELRDRIAQVDRQIIKARDEWWEPDSPSEPYARFRMTRHSDGWLLLRLGVGMNHGRLPAGVLLNMIFPASWKGLRLCDPEGNPIVGGSVIDSDEDLTRDGQNLSAKLWNDYEGLPLVETVTNMRHFRIDEAEGGDWPVVFVFVGHKRIYETVSVPPTQNETMNALIRSEYQKAKERRPTKIDAENRIKLRQVINEQIADLKHQRTIVWEWSELRREGSGINERWRWDDRKDVLHEFADYAVVFEAVEDAWGAIAKLDVPQDKQTSYHRDIALQRIDEAVDALRKASDATP